MSKSQDQFDDILAILAQAVGSIRPFVIGRLQRPLPTVPEPVRTRGRGSPDGRPQETPKHNRNRRQSAEYTEAHRGLLALQADEFQWTPFQIVCGCQTNDCTFGFRDMKKDKKPYADDKMLTVAGMIHAFEGHYKAVEELLARIPETFSAWQIFTALQGQRARARGGAESRLLLAFRAFWPLGQDRRFAWSLAFRRRKTCERQRVSVLCTAVEVLMLRQVLLSWSSQAHSQWKGRIHREKRIVQASADSLARRLVQVAGLLAQLFLVWKAVPREARLSSSVFVKAYFCGLKEPQNARPGQGPAQTLRAVLLQQRLGRLRLQGAETVLELRHARQASVFGLWRTHSFLHAHLRRVARPIFGVRRSGMLQALFRSWGNFAERASLARLRVVAGWRPNVWAGRSAGGGDAADALQRLSRASSAQGHGVLVPDWQLSCLKKTLVPAVSCRPPLFVDEQRCRH
ncbi:unnamed protein product [Durusdinium trenchii]|uniref:Uncharacterized protein n=1 Tax=Durusdinium trenchii TaxID=1381693 RepID=A0ABP0RUB4_9DINO